MKTNAFAVAILASHPTQIEAPLFREIARTGLADLEVYYLEENQAAVPVDHELGFSPEWDIPLKEGYKSVSCPRGLFERVRFLGRRCFASRRYDMVIVPGYRRLDVALLALRYWGPALGMRLDTVSIYPEPQWKTAIRRLVLRQWFRRYAVLYPVGSLTETFLEDLGVEPTRIFRFPYAVDNQSLGPRAEHFRRDRAQMLGELALSPNAFVVLGVLKFVPRENPLELVRGFQLFHARYPQSALLLVGAGPLGKELRRFIAGAGLSDVVRLVGYARYSDLPRWYAVSDVFVHPAVKECWGVSLNEAMACGLPVVASDRVGAAYDLVLEGFNGYRYRSGDCEALSDCLEKVARRGGRSAMGGESQRVVAEWSYRTTLASLGAALAKVTGKSRPELPVG